MKKLGVALVEKDKSSEIKQDVAGTNFKHAEVDHKEAGFFVFYFDNPSDKYIEGALHFSGKGVQIDKVSFKYVPSLIVGEMSSMSDGL